MKHLFDLMMENVDHATVSFYSYIHTYIASLYYSYSYYLEYDNHSFIMLYILQLYLNCIINILHVFMTDSSITNSDQPTCYVSDSPTDQCSSTFSFSDSFPNGLNYYCKAIFATDDAIASVSSLHYSSNGAVDSQACKLFKSNY